MRLREIKRVFPNVTDVILSLLILSVLRAQSLSESPVESPSLAQSRDRSLSRVLSQIQSETALSLSDSHCRDEYRVVPKIASPKLNHSSPVSLLFATLNKEAVLKDDLCYYWTCRSEKYKAKEGEEPKECKWCLPHVMVAGYSKCGTTAFCDKLSHHPEIKKYRKKEVNIFTKLNNFTWEIFENRVEDRQRERVKEREGGRRYWLDCTSGAFRDLQVVTHLSRYSPQTKVIFLVRDPWQRIGSYLTMIQRNSDSPTEYQELLERFQDKITRHGRQPDSIRLSSGGIKHLAEVNNFMFVENYLVWRASLSSKMILVLDHYDLQHTPLLVMRTAEKFLGISRYNYSENVLRSTSANTVRKEGDRLIKVHVETAKEGEKEEEEKEEKKEEDEGDEEEAGEREGERERKRRKKEKRRRKKRKREGEDDDTPTNIERARVLSLEGKIDGERAGEIEQESTALLHAPYALRDKRTIAMSKRLFLPSLCLFEAVMGWSIAIVTPGLGVSLSPRRPPPLGNISTVV